MAGTGASERVRRKPRQMHLQAVHGTRLDGGKWLGVIYIYRTINIIITL